jgi:hypothetical protein
LNAGKHFAAATLSFSLSYTKFRTMVEMLAEILTSNSCVLRGIFEPVNGTFFKLDGYLKKHDQIESLSAFASSHLSFLTSEMQRASSISCVPAKCLIKGSSSDMRPSMRTGFGGLTVVSIIRFISILSIIQLVVIGFLWLFCEIQILIQIVFLVKILFVLELALLPLGLPGLIICIQGLKQYAVRLGSIVGHNLVFASTRQTTSYGPIFIII